MEVERRMEWAEEEGTSEVHNSIEVTIISAQGLKDMCMFGKMSPYALAWVDADDKYCTPVAHNAGCNPAWDHKIYIPQSTPPPSGRELRLQLYSRMGGREDPLLGSASIPLADINASLQYMACQLQRPSGRIHGLLNISVQTCHSDREALESSSCKRILETYGSFNTLDERQQQDEQQQQQQQQRDREREQRERDRERERQEREREREQREREKEHEQREREREQKERDREREQRVLERERDRERREKEQRERDEHQHIRLQQLKLEPAAGLSTSTSLSTPAASSSRPRRASAVLTAPDILDLGEVENPPPPQRPPRRSPGPQDGGSANGGGGGGGGGGNGGGGGGGGGQDAADGGIAGGDLGTYYLGSQASSAMDNLAGR